MIIAIANQKGGVGKTTTTHNLGVALAEQGKSVLLVDLDSQASLTISVGLEPLENENNIVSILKKNNLSANKCIIKLKENLDIITSIIDLAVLEMELLSRPSREKILDRALKNIREKYDYILIDCPPQLSILTMNALSCADKVIIPTETAYLGYRGLEQLQNTIDEVKELMNEKLEVIGVIATLFNSRANSDKEILEFLQEKYNVLGIIKRTTATTRGIYDGLAVVEREPNSEIAKEYKKIALEIIESRE